MSLGRRLAGLDPLANALLAAVELEHETRVVEPRSDQHERADSLVPGRVQGGVSAARADADGGQALLVDLGPRAEEGDRVVDVVRLAHGDTDVAFVWLPLPDDASFASEPLLSEPRWVALPADHRLADRDEVAFEELLDEPFLALPRSAGRLRDFWLGADERGSQPPRVAAEVASADATFEAVAGGVGLALVAAGNAKLYERNCARSFARGVRG